MARPRARDYDDKRRAMLDAAAELFARHGYGRTSMAEIAKACGSSKALLYHYWSHKEDLLDDMLRGHVAALAAAVEAADDPALAPVARLRALVGALLAAYEGADGLHKVQINELALLPRPRRREIEDIERGIVARFATAIGEINPALASNRVLLKPVTMSLFGMLNWHHLWFRPDGAMTRAAYADLVVAVMTGGIAAIAGAAPPALGPPAVKVRQRRRAVEVD